MSANEKEETKDEEELGPEEDEEEDEEEEEEESYAEAEPVLTYIRMKNDINDILQKDSVSCIKADHKVWKRHIFRIGRKKIIYNSFASLQILVIGTHWGKIHLLDHDGNKIMTREFVGLFFVNQLKVRLI